MIKHKAFASTRVLALMLGAAFITSGKAKADFVIPDDLIVQGSACVGLDCVDGESFGFDTLRLKENNTRIKFDDTSTSVGFPNNDWQLTANDSASGGLNKFSIENTTTATVPFTIVGAAPTNSLFVDNSGRLGIKTAVPGLNIHISTSDTPAQRLEQTTAGGFSAQTWDIGGNEANFFIRDLTGGSRLPFRIRPGAPTSSIDINAAGNVGIGTASPGFLSAVATHIATVHGGTTRAVLELVSAANDAAANTAGQVAFFADANTGVGKQIAAILGDTAGTTANNRGATCACGRKQMPEPLRSECGLTKTAALTCSRLRAAAPASRATAPDFCRASPPRGSSRISRANLPRTWRSPTSWRCDRKPAPTRQPPMCPSTG